MVIILASVKAIIALAKGLQTAFHGDANLQGARNASTFLQNFMESMHNMLLDVPRIGLRHNQAFRNGFVDMVGVMICTTEIYLNEIRGVLQQNDVAVVGADAAVGGNVVDGDAANAAFYDADYDD